MCWSSVDCLSVYMKKGFSYTLYIRNFIEMKCPTVLYKVYENDLVVLHVFASSKYLATKIWSSSLFDFPIIDLGVLVRVRT